MIRHLLVALSLIFMSTAAHSEIMEREYNSFILWVDCDLRATVMFEYSLSTDSGNVSPKMYYKYDKEIPPRCQPLSQSGYFVNDFITTYLVPPNHMDSSSTSISETAFMVNIVPFKQNSGMIWSYINRFEECSRDTFDINSYGGALYDNKSYTNFMSSHGVLSPTALWKVVSFNNHIWAFLVPIDSSSNVLSDFIVSPAELERVIGFTLPIEYSNKFYKQTSVPIDTSQCDLR